jgi:acetyltransferase
LETAKVIITAQTKFDKPIFPVFMGSQSTMEAHRLFEKNHMVSFETYEVIPVIIEKILKTAQFSHKNGGTSHSPESLSALAHEAELQDILELASNKKFLNLQESMTVLELADIHTTPLHLVKHEEELGHLSRKLHFPVVAKIASDEITHKTEVKGVITGIRDLSELKSAFKNLSAVAGKKGCYVQQMVHGTELFVGVKRDSTFGPVVPVLAPLCVGHQRGLREIPASPL